MQAANDSNVFIPDEVVLNGILSFVDVRTLATSTQVCSDWNRMCLLAIQLNLNRLSNSGRKKSFETNQELRDAVRKYNYNNPEDGIEELASAYGYPL